MNCVPISEPGLDVCAREPIHIPGAIQPHGALLAVREPELTISQASVNCDTLLGLNPADLLGRNLYDLLDPEEKAKIADALEQKNPAQESPLAISFNGRRFDALLHRNDGVLIVELEPAPPGAENFARHHRRLQGFIEEMQHAATLPAFYAVVARAVSQLTGYERVMVYKFDADWNGEVLGEMLTADVDSYVGLHFPASDIPAQARALYARSWLRIIPTVDYTPAVLEPALNPQTGRPLDLSYAVLRSVSPIHLEYLRNMEVGASMSISLLVEGKLWGLIACHHRTERQLPFAVRAACELFGQITSREITAKQEEERLGKQAEINTIQTRFFDAISRAENLAEALLRYAPSLLEFMNAAGAAICLGGQCSLVGQTPPRDQVSALLSWLQERGEEPVFATDSLSLHWAPAAAFKELVSGLLSVKISRVEPHFVLWFRPEVLATVNWAGEPKKSVDGRLHPRKSFAIWQETVTGRSLPWNDGDLRGAHELRGALNALVIRRTERLLYLNTELERKNSDLNSFAYIASHDLKEPLRGIHHFSRFLREDHAAELGAEGLRKVDTIAALASNTNDLLIALAHFSEIGRMELTLRESDLRQILDEVLASLAAAVHESAVEIRRPRNLPSERCDPVLVREIFANLIANAIKYNDKPVKWVEISWRDPEPGQEGRGPVFTVSDNGIGIRDRNLDAAFQMFRRLNKHTFSGGTGAGLAIVKSVVERHGGHIWVESVLGEGSTFLFTLR
ncbi:MAG: multi-sensor signal transduction histidine kinase [Chthoniobacteraceae bacterium]|nr:multi-sensor signal transduction histidine kinase [Chthoniobacteraceae bacterium]